MWIMPHQEDAQAQSSEASRMMSRSRNAKAQHLSSPRFRGHVPAIAQWSGFQHLGESPVAFGSSYNLTCCHIQERFGKYCLKGKKIETHQSAPYAKEMAVVEC